jgi:subtilisin family serine protease
MAAKKPPGNRRPGGGPPAAGGGSPPPPGPGEATGRAPGTAPAGATSAEEEAAARKRDAESQRIQLGRAAVLPQLTTPEGRRALGLPADEDLAGDYMVELNVSHRGGIRAASRRFQKLHERVVKDPERPTTPVGRTYYYCQLKVSDWKSIINADENLSERDYDSGDEAEDLTAPPRAGGSPGVAPDDERGPDGKIKVERRAIYRLWPDFQIKAQINHSVATVKADAALLSYSASGKGIVWAVLDSGVDATHPHFGLEGRDHTLLDPAVVDLHRDFTDLKLADPDVDPDISEDKRQVLLNAHRTGALTDAYHHGTHVAGIIAGGLTEKTVPRVAVRVFERKFNRDDRDRMLQSTIEETTHGMDDPGRLHGVAPRCRLISLKVLDDQGFGRTSNVLRALDYIRANLNANPKLMLVHGINLSVGYEFDAQLFACGQSPICVEVDRLVQSGVVVVTAAGNTGYGTVAAEQRLGARVGLSNTINDPGNAALAITVGATHRDSPHTYGVSYFSSKGPTGDGRLKPDLVAPGERITSCAAGQNLDFIRVQLQLQHLEPLVPPPPLADLLAAGAGATAPGAATTGAPAAAAPSAPPQASVAVAAAATGAAAPPPAQPTPSAAYIDDSGTSMAAPHVSGAIAAFLSVRREFIGKPLEVKRIFLESATSLGRERYFEGNGLIDLMRAIQSV